MRGANGRRTLRWGATGAVLAVVGGGIAYAAIPTNGQINGCYTKANGALRVIDPSLGQQCNSKETALPWNQTGPQGPGGATGPEGARGPSDGYSVNTGLNSVNFNIDGDLSATTVATLDLPAGSYLLNAKALVGNSAADDAYVTCTLRYGLGAAVLIDIAETRLAGGAPQAAGSSATLPLTGAFTVGAQEFPVWLVCTTTSANAYRAYGQLNAVRVATLTSP